MHKYFRCFIIWFLFLLSAFTGLAQEYGNRHYQTEDGLPGSIVYSITMDKQGRVMFATDQGISIFNGNAFRNIGKKEGLEENEVLILFNDSKNRTWVTTFGNKLYCYEKGKVSAVYHDTTGKLNHTKLLWEDGAGDIWVVGRTILRKVKDKFLEIKLQYDFQNVYTYERGGKWYFVSGNGTSEIDSQNNLRHISNKLARYYEGSFKWKNKIYFYHQNFVDEYIETSENLFVKKSKKSFGASVNRIKTDKYNNLWVLTNGDGAVRIDGESGDTTRFLPGSSVSDVLVDDDRNVWLSTLGDGVYKVYFPFVTWYSKSTGFISDHFYSVASDGSNGLLAGDINGNIYNLKEGSKRNYRFTPADISNRILDIIPVDKQTFYAATDMGLIRFDMSSGNSFKVVDSLKSFKFIKKTSRQTLLAGNYKYCMEIGSPPEYKLINIWNKKAFDAEIKNEKQFYIASLDGIYEITKGQSQVLPTPFYPYNDRVNSIEWDRFGVLWIATYNSGVYSWWKNKLIHLSDSTGLAGNSCKHLFIAQNGDLFVSTDKGVSRIRTLNWMKEEFQIINYTTDNGLPSNEANQCVVINNKLWVATGKGLVAINLGTKIKEKNPEIVINSVATTDSLFSNTDLITIPFSSNFIDLNFEGISLSGGRNLVFKYRLEGIDKNWNYTTTNTIRYGALSPGNFVFQIVAVNKESGLESKPSQIKFTILTPWWRTGVFIVMAGMLTLITIILLFLWRLRKLEQRGEIRNRMLSAEIKSIRSQMDPHFIFNALNSIQGYVMQNEKMLANHYLTSFSRLMRMVLETSNRSFVTIQEEMQFLELYLNLEQLRFNHKFTYRIECDEDINNEMAEVPGMLLQPLVENAVIHGVGPKQGPGQILVKFETRHEKIVCIVEDDGGGFYNLVNAQESNFANVHNSFGFKAIEDRIKLLNSLEHIKVKFRVSASEFLDRGKGTRVEIEIKEKAK